MKNIVRNSVVLICCSALLFLASCEKDNLDDTNTTVTGSNGNEFDCEELALNFGDVCEGEGFSGVVNQNCQCVDNENFCSVLIGGNANYPSGYIGDECWTTNDQQGFISENCECVENESEFHCLDFYGDFPGANVENFNVGDDCEIFGPGGWGDFLGMGTVSVDCECVESNSFDPDCPEFYFEGFSDGNYGSPCEAPGATLVGIIGDDCDCIDDPNFDCPDLGNIGDFCVFVQGGTPYPGTVSVDCECVESNSFEPDCPEFYFEGWSDGNYGSPCETPDVPQGGIIGDDCECIENENFCSVLTGSNANYPSGYIGDECWTINDQQGFISENCECLEN
tara:strand:+ start:463 stop:1473 length:1011 start_codon:yes stop_codon:yes gene_type:complete